MKFRVLSLFALVISATSAFAAENDDRVYELRVYYAPAGKLDALHTRFRDHTTKLFEKHGMANIGYWTPIENPDRKLIYVLAYPNREAAQKSWTAFLADPDWQKAHRESERDGRLVSKIESTFLSRTDYSPEIKPAAGDDRVFELRTYTTTSGNLDRLHKRFRDHTTKLFEKHGMMNVGYWSPVKNAKGADDTLIYILAHKSVDAAKSSFDAFRKDNAWIKAKGESEKEAGGSLTAKDGVKSEFLKATDYSPIR